jgi:hypothetical protein
VLFQELTMNILIMIQTLSTKEIKVEAGEIKVMIQIDQEKPLKDKLKEISNRMLRKHSQMTIHQSKRKEIIRKIKRKLSTLLKKIVLEY